MNADVATIVVVARARCARRARQLRMLDYVLTLRHKFQYVRAALRAHD